MDMNNDDTFFLDVKNKENKKTHNEEEDVKKEHLMCMIRSGSFK